MHASTDIGRLSPALATSHEPGGPHADLSSTKRWTTPAARSRTPIDAATQEEAQQLIRQKGFFVTKIAEKAEQGARAARPRRAAGKRKKKSFTIGRISTKQLCTFTRQLSTLQDAGLPILRSLKILEGQCKPGVLKNALGDIVEDIESGQTLSEAFAKHPKAFDRLYCNMIKAGEAGGALEAILQRLADFKEKAQSLKRRIKSAPWSTRSWSSSSPA